METGKQSSEGSTPPCDQPGTSRDLAEQACQNLPCKENSQVTLVQQPKKVSYSTEMLNTWRDIRWFQIPLSSLRRPKAGLFSFRFQSSLQEYQQLRKTKRLKVGRPFSVLPFHSLSVTLNDISQDTLYKPRAGCSGTGRVKRRKYLSASRKAPVASVPARPQHRLQLDHKCLTMLPATDSCDCKDRNTATPQNPVVGANRENCPSVNWVAPGCRRMQPYVALHRIHQPYWHCCHWNMMSPVPPSPQHRLWSSYHCKHHGSTTLHAIDVCGSKNCSTGKAQVPRMSASRVNSVFTESMAQGPSSTQPCVLLRRICLAQDLGETAPEDWDEPRPPAEEFIPRLPRVLLNRICLTQDQCKTASEDWDEPRPHNNQPCTEEFILRQPRILLHRICLAQDQCKTASENWDEPRLLDNQPCTEEFIPRQPRILLHRICLAQDQCETATQDWDDPGPLSEAEKPILRPSRVLLHRICPAQDQCKTASEDWDEPRPHNNQPCTEEFILRQPRILLRPICLAQDRCKTTSEDRDELRSHDNQPCAEEFICMQPHVLLRRISLSQEPQHFSRRMYSRQQKCRSPACFLSKRFVFCSEVSRQRQKGKSQNTSRKKQKPVAHCCSEQDLASDPAVFSHLLSPGHPLTDTTGNGEGTHEWGNADSPLPKEDDMFPEDWTPPRIDFLYYDDNPPPLSPAPGPTSESRSSGEMPDITEEVFGSQVMEFTAKVTSTQSTFPILNKATVTHTKNAALLETEKEDVAGPEHLVPSFHQLAKEELEGATLVEKTRAKNWTAFSSECSSLPSPFHSSASASTIHSRSSSSTSCDELEEDREKLILDSDGEGGMGPECAPSQLPTHPLIAPSRISSSSSISTFSHEFAWDPEKLTLDSDVEGGTGPASSPLQLPTHPLMAPSRIFSKSSISTSSDEFAGDREKLTLDSDVEGDMGPECTRSQFPTHPLMASSRNTPSSSTSTSSEEVAGDQENLTLDSDMERGMGPECPPSQLPTRPLMAPSRISSRSSSSISSDEFAGGREKLTLDSDVEGHMSPGCTLSQFPTHPLMASSRNSSSSSTSTSSEEVAGDQENLTLDSDVEGDIGLECPPSELPTIPLTASSTISSRSSISASPNEMNLGSHIEEDTDDSNLISLRDLLQGDDVNHSSAELNAFPSSGPDCYLSSLDKLLEEKREQIQEDEELERSLGEKLLLSNSLSSVEVVEENAVSFPEAHRLLLKRFSISQGSIPAVHPGENIFDPLPYPQTAPALDTTGLMPQNQLESLFFCSQFAQQMALLHDGFLIFLYCGGQSHCPHPVQRWLFQLMSLNSEVSTDAFQALWEITAHQIAANDKVSTDLWFPKLKDITQAFCNLGACASALSPGGLVQLEWRSKDLEFSEHLLEPAEMWSQSLPQKNSHQLTLAAMLGNIFKFLTLCAASYPHSYPDHQRMALLVLLCRLSLDRNLQKQPLLELQQLLLVLLEGIRDWQAKLLELCKSLCHVSQHHHNLVTVMRLFPDTTDRGRQLRRNLSLCFIATLLGKMSVATSPWQEEIQLQQLGRLLPLMKPTFLKQCLQKLPKHWDGKEQQEALAELDQEACYLCYSLLILANVVVGTQAMSSSKQGPLQHLCVQLQQHISANIREDPGAMYRTELKNLVAQTYVKWQELLSQSWLQGQS